MNSITSNPRANALTPPPKEVLNQCLNIDKSRVEWLAGDGSDRCYYRITSPQLDQSLVLMQLSQQDAKALAADGYDWIKIAEILHKANIPIPRPVKTIPEYATLIIQDYGDTMLESEVLKLKDNASSKQDRLYEKSVDIITTMLSIPRGNSQVWETRSFDQDKYIWELNFFRQQYLNTVANVKLSKKDAHSFEKETKDLAQYLENYSVWFCHRDFHSRNIMVKGEELALIDFQDARLGSAVYDLVSLAFDNYIPFENSYRSKIMDMGLEKIRAHLPSTAAGWDEPIKATILQRQLKAIGTYGYLTVTKKRGNYLSYVPVALKTLTHDLVGDQRWPFLSQTVPKLIGEKLA